MIGSGGEEMDEGGGSNERDNVPMREYGSVDDTGQRSALAMRLVGG